MELKSVESSSLVIRQDSQAKQAPSPAASIKEILSLSVGPIVGWIFHPVYQLVNAAVVGRMDNP